MDSKKDYYFIEGTANKDWVGFKSYLETLNNAIDDNAKFIGLISDYGTGKSTLINMLKNDQEQKSNKLITINLWNCGISNLKEIDIHRIFLHQLIDKLDINNKDYYKKKIHKDYSIFDIKFENKRYIYAICLFIFYILCIFEALGFITLFIEELKLIGYFLIASLTILCIIFYKPVLSYKKSDTSRNIDENDTKDLYLEIIKKHFQQVKDNNQTLIICLEELDRYDDVNTILEYLKEFYKFYKETNANQKIVFIVSIKSASELSKNFNEKLESENNEENNEIKVKNIKNVYEKIFDFILNLNSIHIQDYDSIILELIEEKKDNMPIGIKIPSKNNLKNWKYLYAGNNIKIRDIKHRYNFAISLYLSVQESGINADFNKCLFISYLEDEYNDLYEQLTSDNNLLNSILINYSNKKREFKDLKIDNEEYESVLLEGLDSKFVSVDYNYYFFKFPKNKKSYNMFEYTLYNAIFFDEDDSNLNIVLKKLDEKQILELIDKRTNDTFLPKIIFKYPKLIKISHDYRTTPFNNTLIKQYDITNNFNQFTEFVSNAKKLPKKYYVALLEEYFENQLKSIKELSVEEIFNIRKKIVHILKDNSVIVKDLFFENNNLISDEEIKDINDFNNIFILTNFKNIDDNCINSYVNIINNSNKTNLLKFLKEISNNDKVTNESYKKLFYSINFNNYKFTEKDYKEILKYSEIKLQLSIPKNYRDYLNKLSHYSEYYDNYYLGILDSNNENEVTDYKNILNRFNKIFNSSMKFLSTYSHNHTVFAFNKDIREEFYKSKYYSYYVISTRLYEKNFEIEDDKFGVLSDEYIHEYEYRTNWNCKVGNEMKKFLYKNVNMSKLNPQRLAIFNDMLQTKNLIEAVLNTNDHKFINKYLYNIRNIKPSEIRNVFESIGYYNRHIRSLNPRTKDNLKHLTKNKKYIELLDARRKEEINKKVAVDS